MTPPRGPSPARRGEAGTSVSAQARGCERRYRERVAGVAASVLVQAQARQRDLIATSVSHERVTARMGCVSPLTRRRECKRAAAVSALDAAWQTGPVG